MTSDDNHDDDVQLQQLRAVWVSMRDEEPPERGLASLMAAARTKAAELEHAGHPAWWQRIAATLRRPPVLALATVTLLLGGALIVTQRSSQMNVDATAVDESSPVKLTETRMKGESTPPAAGSSAVMDLEQGIQAPAVTKLADTVADPVVAGPRRSAGARPATKTKATAPAPPTSAQPDTGALASGESFEGGTIGGAGAAAPQVLSIAQDDASGATVEAHKQVSKKPLARTPAPSIEGEGSVTSADGGTPTLDRLVKQCETAAARGDCTAVRAIAQKILSTAPAAYRSRVANNAAINRCMPDTSPNTAAE